MGGAAERSYPASEVGVATRGVTLHLRSGVAAGRSYPTPPCLKPGAAAKRSSPTSKEPWLRECRRAERSYPTLVVRKGGGEEIPLVQGKEQGLHFAGPAVKRYPTPKVRETQVRR